MDALEGGLKNTPKPSMSQKRWTYRANGTICLSVKYRTETIMARVEVVVHPEVMSGDPCIFGTRVAAETIIINLRAGYSIDSIYEAYPTLPDGAIEAAIRWAESSGVEWRH